ncbi:MAG: TetR/AcrR family transcriptional regulator [Pseudomonadota bacterium]
MPYTAKHKAETRARIAEAARRLFNRHGFDAVSIDDIMASAGLTRGGFYNHFTSKDALYAEAINSHAHQDTSAQWGLEIDPGGTSSRLAAQIVNAYLSPQHLSDLENHCPMIALPSDIARAGPGVRQTYEALLGNLIGMFQAGVDPNRADARQAALGMTALCVGGMVIARTIENDVLASEVREAARAVALQVGDLEENRATMRAS